MSALEKAYEVLHAAIGTESPPGDWCTVTQEQVNQFADVRAEQFLNLIQCCIGLFATILRVRT